MSVNACRKGKHGEREACSFLRSLGYGSARRTQQHNGNAGDSDVTCDELPGLHIEVKFGYSAGFDLGTKLWRNAVRQCESDANGEDWVLLWKPRGVREWRMTLVRFGLIVTVTGPSLAAVLKEWHQ